MKKFFFYCLIALALLPATTSAKSRVPHYGKTGKAAAYAVPKNAPPRLNIFQERRLEDLMSGFVSMPDTLRLLVVQVQFADSLMGGRPGSLRPEKRDSLFFANELKHLRDYFIGASRGRFTLTWDLIGHVYTMPEKMGYYGYDPEEETRVVELARTVIDSVDASWDLSRYHTLFIIHAGAGQETDSFDDSREQLWSSFFDLADIRNAFPDSSIAGLATDDSLQGKPFYVDNFAIAPANAGQDITSLGSLGIWAFEIGSRIGLLPLFDGTPELGFDSMGAGNYDLMSWGLYTALGFIPAFPSAFNRVLAGWVDPLTVDRPGRFRLHDINTPSPGDTACLKIPINEREYFLVVNRVHDTNFDSLFTFVNLDSDLVVPGNADSLLGAEFDFFLTDLTNPYEVRPDPDAGGILRRYVDTGSGIYVWHIDEGVILANLTSGHLPNDFAERKGVDLEEADGIQDLDGLGFFSQGSYYDSFRKGHNDSFGPDTKPSSDSNGGVPTGIVLSGISKPDSFMTLDVDFANPYVSSSTTWNDSTPRQPPTAVDLDGDGRSELLVMAAGGRVYAFNSDGTEYVDRDGDPRTISPYFTAPGAEWVGAAAAGDMDGAQGDEIVAASRSGRLYAWHGDSTEVTDGDGDPLTEGVLHAGLPIAAAPMLVDIHGDGIMEVVLVEHTSDSLRVSLIDAGGFAVKPPDQRYASYWPAVIHGQICSAPAYGICDDPSFPTDGVVIAWADTIRSVFGLSYVPVKDNAIFSAPGAAGTPRTVLDEAQATADWSVEVPMSPSFHADSTLVLAAPAVGDVDADGIDEVVTTLPDGRLLIYDSSARPELRYRKLSVVDLRGNNPSPPALGDVNADGVMEIALVDSDYFYLLTFDGKDLLDWPRRIRPIDAPPGPAGMMKFAPPAPVIADIDGDGGIEVVYRGEDGSLHAFDAQGASPPTFPRQGPGGMYVTPTLCDLDGSGDLSLVMSGSSEIFEYQDAVTDSMMIRNTSILSIQNLPSSRSGDVVFWGSYRNGNLRWGRTQSVFPKRQREGLAEKGSFLVYPNPVRSSEVHARLVLNGMADVTVEIYNMEGELALSKTFRGENPGGTAGYIFDERFDIGGLSSGVYFLRLHVRGSNQSDVMVKTIAVSR
jgi:M6 family metalloprotease-like protein